MDYNRIASHPISPPVVSVFTIDASFCALAPNPGDAADIIMFLHQHLFDCILSDVLKELDCTKLIVYRCTGYVDDMHLVVRILEFCLTF